MDTMQGFLLAVGWFVLRFGLPILATGILIWVLSRLDSRWQQEALERRKKMIRDGVIPMVKCWVVQECPPEKRRGCRAYQEKYIPCWQVFRDPTKGRLQGRCLSCDVFRKAPIPIIER